jgi:acetolactate synthase-1/2/3 large subunit
MYGKDAYHASELSETNYADVVEALGCRGIRVESPDQIGASLRSAMQEKNRPTVLDVVVTRDPASMLPGVDNRATKIKKGDRVA